MTPEELAALAIYKTHKYCECRDCTKARQVLKRMDERRDGK